MSSEGARAFVITVAIGTGMAMFFVAVNQAALLLNYQGNYTDAIIATLTLLIELMLFIIVWVLIREVLLARKENELQGKPIPQILTSILALFIIVSWLSMALILFHIGTAVGWDIFSEGYTEPESQLFWAMLIFSFVFASFYFLVWGYQIRNIASWLWDWYSHLRVRRKGGCDA